MYVYERAIVRELGKEGRWVDADLSQTVVADIYTEYEKAYLILSHEVLDDPVALDMDEVAYTLGANQVLLTVLDWLSALGNAALPTTDDVPAITTLYARYLDAWMADFTIEPVSKTKHWDLSLPKSERPDLRLTRDDTDYEKLYKECLVSVNGLFHLTNQGQDALYVDDGAKSGFHANSNHVGIYQLGRIGQLECVPITEEMIHKLRPEQKFQDYAYLHLDRDLENKQVGLVLGGYLHLLDKTMVRTGPNTFRVDFNNLPYVERFYQSRKLIDLSSVEEVIETSPNNPDQFVLADFYSDEAITRYLTLPQSFLVVIDTADFFVYRRQLEPTQLPGTFVSHEKPYHPLVTTLGRMPEYWTTEEYDRWVVNVDQNLDVNYNFETYDYKDGVSVDNVRSTTRPYTYSDGYFLVVGKDL